MKPNLPLAALFIWFSSQAQQSLTWITFDGPPPQPPDTAYSIKSYSELGMFFTPIDTNSLFARFGRVGPGTSGLPDNGTAYLDAAAGESLKFSFVDNSVFDLVSIDLAEYSTLFPTPLLVRFVGYRQDGSVVSTELTTDGLIDGTGPLPDFQTFHFGPEFTNLTRVEMPSAGWSIDNLVLAVTCQPASISGGPYFAGVPPITDTLPAGTNATLVVLAGGTPPIYYRWQFNGTNLPGATTSALTFTNTQPADSGSYSVCVSNACGAYTSSPRVLTFVGLPIFRRAPSGEVGRIAGASLSFEALVLGGLPLSFQWQLNGHDIPGATAAVEFVDNSTSPGPPGCYLTTLVFTNVQPTASGTYSLIVSNAYGVVRRDEAVLTVYDAEPWFSPDPVGIGSVPVGASVYLSGTPVGSLPLATQWRFNGAAIPGATRTTLALENLTYNQSGEYTLVATNAFGSSSYTWIVDVVQVLVWDRYGWLWGYTVPAGLTNVSAIAEGDHHLLCLTADGRLVAWDDWTSLADPAVLNTPEELTNVVAVAAGPDFNLALLESRAVAAWGAASAPTNVPAGLTNAVAIAAAAGHALALRPDGTVVGWGWDTNTPPGLSNVIAIAAGASHSLALKADGTVVAWGAAFAPTNVPPGLSNVVALTTGDYVNLVLKSDGTVTAWGSNRFGESAVPSGLSNVVAVSAGWVGCMALKADGTIVRWGDGSNSIPPLLANATAIAQQRGGSGSAALVGGSPHICGTPSNPRWDSSSFTFQLPTWSGRVYALQYADSLTEPVWKSLPLVAGTGYLVTFKDPTATGSQRFYRVLQW